MGDSIDDRLYLHSIRQKRDFRFLFGRVGSVRRHRARRPTPSSTREGATRAHVRARERDDDDDSRDDSLRDDEDEDEAFGGDGGGAWEGTTRDEDDAEGWWGDARARDGARERWRR